MYIILIYNAISIISNSFSAISTIFITFKGINA